MTAIRKSTWMIVILGASAGCAGDEPAAAPDAAPATPPAISRPAMAPDKDGMKGEMKAVTPPAASPAEGKKDELTGDRRPQG